ncbi:hypothetical protein [Kribbella sp. NPDC049227]|uniref:DUF7674 family protein n=1 Tax=Kribbella sp. NPDC049227 TaxID=3364113 RepID=UPI00371045AA
MSEAEDALEQRLYAAVPSLRPEMELFRQTNAEEYAELGLGAPDLQGFLQDLALDCGRRAMEGPPEDVATMRHLFAFLESELGHDPEIDELIETTFVANLPEPDGRYAGVLELLEPRLRAARLRRFQADIQSVPAATVDFLYRLGDAVPGLRSRVVSHAEEHRGRPLPHAFMGEIVLEAADLVASGRGQVVRPLVDFLETEYGADADVDNVIAVSFVEMLPNPGDRGAEIESLLGPKLRAELERQRSWPDPPPEPTA